MESEITKKTKADNLARREDRIRREKRDTIAKFKEEFDKIDLSPAIMSIVDAIFQEYLNAMTTKHNLAALNRLRQVITEFETSKKMQEIRNKKLEFYRKNLEAGRTNVPLSQKQLKEQQQKNSFMLDIDEIKEETKKKNVKNENNKNNGDNNDS